MDTFAHFPYYRQALPRPILPPKGYPVTYKVIAGGLLAGLRGLGIAAEMVSRSGRHAGMVKSGTQEPACFSSPSWYEILARGRKIIGSAQRRVGGAFLQHGSILIGYDPALEAEVIPGGGMQDAVTCVSGAGKRCEAGRCENGIPRGIRPVIGNNLQVNHSCPTGTSLGHPG